MNSSPDNNWFYPETTNFEIGVNFHLSKKYEQKGNVLVFKLPFT